MPKGVPKGGNVPEREVECQWSGSLPWGELPDARTSGAVASDVPFDERCLRGHSLHLRLSTRYISGSSVYRQGLAKITPLARERIIQVGIQVQIYLDLGEDLSTHQMERKLDLVEFTVHVASPSEQRWHNTPGPTCPEAMRLLHVVDRAGCAACCEQQILRHMHVLEEQGQS